MVLIIKKQKNKKSIAGISPIVSKIVGAEGSGLRLINGTANLVSQMFLSSAIFIYNFHINT
jgi:hypothetical protein